jgi:ectoine hydroxylase-related dioxygenase (phytanoyl-CoA dioxygenase family)
MPLVESPFFSQVFNAQNTEPEVLKVAKALNEDGFAVIDFPDDKLDERIEQIKGDLNDRYEWDEWRCNPKTGMRIQDAWRFNDNVRQIAANERVLDLLSKLYGKKAFPFQTLNFPVGTQQATHTDMVHFSSMPERYMCGVWLAFEDIDTDAGPLVYYPGSHKLPFYQNEQLGVVPDDANIYYNYPKYLELWQKLIDVHQLKRVEFHPRKGQALIWAANLFHGGAPQLNKQKTRWSQVTHYYFHGCAYYTPLGSLPFLGSIFYRRPPDVTTGGPVENEINGIKASVDLVEALGPKITKSETGEPIVDMPGTSRPDPDLVKQCDDLCKQIDALMNSKTWRLGHSLTKPARMVRSLIRR